MASKYVRRLLRSGLFIFTSSVATHEAAPRAAAAHRQLKPMQGAVRNYTRNMQQYVPSHCPPPSPAACNSFADMEGEYSSTYDQEQEARIASCSRQLQGKPLIATAFKPLRSRRAASSCSSPSSRSCSSPRKDRKRAPKGHVAVYVEAGQERHVVPIAYLSQPLFQALLQRAEREFGFGQQGPGLRLPCSLSELHHVLRQMRSPVTKLPPISLTRETHELL